MNNISPAVSLTRASPQASLSTLAPELFPLISGLLPRFDCCASLLALASVCRRLRDIIIPHILYRNIYIERGAQAFAFLAKLRGEAALANELNGCLPRSHYIHFLSIDLWSDEVGLEQLKRVVHELFLLMRCGGLRNLESLTIHFHHPSSRMDTEIEQDFWSIAQIECPRLKEVRMTGIEGEGKLLLDAVLRLQHLERLGLEQSGYTILSPGLSTFVSSFTPLHYLELRLWNSLTNEPQDAKELLSHRLPHLRTLILDGFNASQPDLVTDFWMYHFGLRKLVLGPKNVGQWFERFDESMLPNLTVLGGLPHDVRVILPYAANRLRSLILFSTHNAQAPYLLRAVTPDGILPTLRSLSIHLLTYPQSVSINILTAKHLWDTVLEGNRWREDERGNVTSANINKAQRWFDGNYIMSISKAAPNLEELELSGTSRDTLESLTNSLSRFVKLHTLVLSGPLHKDYGPFFESSGTWFEYIKWGCFPFPGVETFPSSFEQAACGLAQDCPSLDMVCIRNRMGRRDKSIDLACRIIHEGSMKDVVMRKMGGMVIEREEEW